MEGHFLDLHSNCCFMLKYDSLSADDYEDCCEKLGGFYHMTKCHGVMQEVQNCSLCLIDN